MNIYKFGYNSFGRTSQIDYLMNESIFNKDEFNEISSNCFVEAYIENKKKNEVFDKYDDPMEVTYNIYYLYADALKIMIEKHSFIKLNCLHSFVLPDKSVTENYPTDSNELNLIRQKINNI